MKISRGKIELRISSLNHGKIIEKFKKEGITLYNCKREYKRLSCRISLEEKNRVITLLEKNNLDFKFEKRGIWYLFFNQYIAMFCSVFFVVLSN